MPTGLRAASTTLIKTISGRAGLKAERRRRPGHRPAGGRRPTELRPIQRSQIGLVGPFMWGSYYPYYLAYSFPYHSLVRPHAMEEHYPDRLASFGRFLESFLSQSEGHTVPALPKDET